MAMPPPGMNFGMGFGVPMYPPIPPLGTPMINMAPQNQYTPRFDGMFAAGTQTVPYDNFLLNDVNMFQQSIYGPNGLGYAPMMGPMPGMPPMGMPPNTMPPPAGGHGGATPPPTGHSGGH